MRTIVDAPRRPAVPHVGDSKRLIDGLAGQQNGPRAAGEDGPLVLGGEPLLYERANEQACKLAGARRRKNGTIASA